MNELITQWNRLSKAYSKNRFYQRNGQLLTLFSTFLLSLFVSSFTQAQEYGVEVENGVGIIYFENQPEWTDGWNYICLDADCRSGALVDGRWEREIASASAGSDYTIQLKISATNGQYISPQYTVTAVAKGDSGNNPDPLPTCDDGIQNGDETGVDCGGSCEPCITTPPPTSNTVEAETSSILGSAAVYNDGTASGGQGVAYISEIGAGFSITNAPSATAVEIVYASELSGKISIYVNGSDAGDVNFSSTGAWVGNYQSVSANVNVPAGATFDVQFQSGDVALNVDRVIFTGELVPSCTDGIQNGTETGIDCGGDCPNICIETYALNVENGSGDGEYEAGEVVTIEWEQPPVAAGTGIIFTEWTGDVAGIADLNAPNTTITMPAQNVSVTANFEITHSCGDGIQNGDETAVDCGGSCDCTPGVAPLVSARTEGDEVILIGASGSSQDGYTIYTWDNDTDEFSQCEGNCADNWPPVLVDNPELLEIPNLPEQLDGTFGLSGRCDGTLQLTYNDQPLYFYIGDNQPGDTNGDQPTGTWHMVSASTVVLPTCSDGIKNGDEEGIDCGGSCSEVCNPCDDQPIGPELEGDNFIFGLNSDGVAYHQNVSHSPSFFVISLNGAGAEGGVNRNSDKGNRYEADFSSVVVPGEVYTLEVRIQGDNYPTGQCIHSIQVQVGEGVDSTPCQTGTSGGTEEPNLPDPVLTVLSNSQEGAYLAGASGSSSPGRAMYTTSGTCETTECLEAWSPVLVEDPELVNNPGGITNSVGAVYFGQVDCTDQYQVTLDGQELYFYVEDQSTTDIKGHNVGPWSLALVDRLPKLPDHEYMMPALKTPINGRTPGTYGWTHDIEGRSIEVRAGESVLFQWAQSHFVGGVGLVYDGPGDHDWTFVCSCNQKEYYEAEMTDVSKGVMQVEVPANCYDKYYYYFRYKKAGLPSDDLGTQIVYSALFEYDEREPNDRIDPAQQPTITSNSANWMRFRHPRAHDGNTELIFNSQNNSSQLRALERYSTTVTTGGNGTTINANLPNILRIEAFDNGLIYNSNPAYAYNQNTCCGDQVDYGNVVTYEITIGSSPGISSQTYNTFQHIVVGKGFSTSIADPRLTMAGDASTTMEFSTAGSHVDLEQDAIFTQHLTTLTSTDDVDDFLEGHHIFHGLTDQHEALASRPVFGSVKIGEESCQNCHFRDGRGSELVETPDGPRIAPPVFGTGILQYIEGAEAILTWDGDVATVEQQVKNALVNDHKVDPATALSAEEMRQLVAYVEFLTVPNRNAAAYLDQDVVDGHLLFDQVGCASCHQETQKTRSDAPEKFRNLYIRPFSDMKTHDVNGGTFRTPPLWGLGRNLEILERNGKATLFMHDGSATTIEQAIQKHNGEATSVRDAYNALSAEEKAKIVKFINTL
ncbi:di-heme oxidoredictase family protein [Flammeovirga aprica]|uniref:Family 31 carbohydrate-binding protein n=1 Tax=Flammeovirga aprica JL-4 TaxID=694437 RepID=A0A7X9S0B3_9BACT|nr:di-heme oxidoredictase family protein [Flammeovirga aprica]NME72031.1 family 31 carbohydrate-binding protein [Flammeovirga aprica JL-4]